MKVPAVPGPPAAHRVAAVAPTGAVAQHPQGHLEGEHQHRHGTHFHAPKPGQRGASLRGGPAPKKAAPQRRRQRAKNADLDDDEPDVHVDDGDSQRIGSGLSEAQFDEGSEGDRDGRDGEGTRDERRVLASMRWLGARAAQPEAAAPALSEVIARLHGVADGTAGGKAGDLSQAPRTVMTVAAWAETARKHLAGQGTAPATLAAVREALLAFAPAAWSEASRSESVRLWLPVFLLNLARPRTQQQLAQAEATLRLLQHARPDQPAAASST